MTDPLSSPNSPNTLSSPNALSLPENSMQQLIYKTGSLDSSFFHVKQGLNELKTQVDIIQTKTMATSLKVEKALAQVKIVICIAKVGGGTLILKGLSMLVSQLNLDVGGLFFK